MKNTLNLKYNNYILITDIGRDTDDTLALLVLLYLHKLSKINLKAIAVSGAKLDLRANCIYYWLNKFKINNIAVISGIKEDFVFEPIDVDEKTKKIINIKGREFVIENFYDGIVKFNFEELCNRNLGSEDYLNISQNSKFILIENLPDFDENNSDQQQRFITLIDIIYEKKIPILISSKNSLDKLNSAQSLSQIFKRTISRLYESTSIKII